MQLKKELIEWYNNQLEEKNFFLSSLEQLSSAYYFLEVLHNYHPKSVDLSKVYLKPKNEYEVLQNYKLLSSCFSKLGWKKFDPERYSKRKQKDYLSLAQLLRKVLSSRSIKESTLHNNLDHTLQQFKNEQQLEPSPKQNQTRSLKIMRLQKTKKQLLAKILQIQEELTREEQQGDERSIQILRDKIIAIVESNNMLS